MTLASGTYPYDYDYGHGPFTVPNPYLSDYPIGLSGTLLEQAQFVITAERRKFLTTNPGGSNSLPDFNVYVNSEIVPSGPYEPKANGSTLGNSYYPAAAFILDHIQETRQALNSLFGILSQDSELSNYEYRAAWLQALYPNNPSGFLLALDPDTFDEVTGHWCHRLPSEIGVVNYSLADVLGSSGVLYDCDIGELMWNPAPHITTFGLDTMHGPRTDGSSDAFSIQQYPFFPAFQRTDGTIITLTGREPTILRLAQDYSIDHITSGTVRLDGYALFANTNVFLGNTANFFNVLTDFSVFAEGIRPMIFGGNIEGSRLFLTPTTQASGVYRVATKNKRSDLPNTTIESGQMSYWPKMDRYWPNAVSVQDAQQGSTTTTANEGYHVFDDCLWMTDVSFNTTLVADTGFPSGLSILSPFTGHRMWVRYADQTPVTSLGLGVFPSVKNWSSAKGLERLSSNVIYRSHPSPKSDATVVSGQFVIMQYNDMLDFVGSSTTTSDNTELGTVNNVPLGHPDYEVHDFWYDDTLDEYWFANFAFAGFSLHKFDSSLNYINKYDFPVSGLYRIRGTFINGTHYAFDGELFSGGTNIRSSGLWPLEVVSEGTEPYANNADTPGMGVMSVDINTRKNINGAPFVGHRPFAEILDVVVVPAATHVQPGVYALVRWARPTGGTSDLYLVRIEEEASSWEIRAITRMETGYGPLNEGRREIIYMQY